MTPKDMPSKITADEMNFVPITVKSMDNDLLCLREYLIPILIRILYNTTNGTHNLWGILFSYTVYSAQNNANFVLPTRPAIYPTIPDDSTSVVPS